MITSEELWDLKQMREQLMRFHAKEIDGINIDFELMLQPLDIVLAEAELHWTHGVGQEEARIVMTRVRTGEVTLGQVSEIVQMARAIKEAFPERSWNQAFYRASQFGSVKVWQERVQSGHYDQRYADEFYKMMEAFPMFKTP